MTHGTSLETTAPVRRYRRADPVAEHLGRALGLTPDSAHQAIYGKGKIAHRMAAIIRAFVAAEKYDALDRFMEPVTRALKGIPSQPLTPALLVRAQTADCMEDIAESQLLASRTPETLRAYQSRLREEIATAQQVLAAVDAEIEGLA